MEPILQFILKHANEVIVIFGIVVLLLLMRNGVHLSNHKSRIEEALNRRNNKYILNTSFRQIESNEDQDAAITPDTIRKYEMEFNKTCSFHSVLVQLIPVFPLFGILGTVSGLILGAQSINALEKMMESLNVSLSSTFFGLIFAILLKFIEAVFPSRIIYDVEVMLDDFDKKLNIAEMFQNFKA